MIEVNDGLENKFVNRERYTVYIASWINAGGNFDGGMNIYHFGTKDESLFTRWLRKMGMTDEEIIEVVKIAMTGKFEFEADAREFISTNKEPSYSKWYLFK